MPAKQSQEVRTAMQLVNVEGKTVYEAAHLAGVWPSTLYRALKNKGKKFFKKGLTTKKA